MIYYALTTLSSVGLGDYFPKNSEERVFITLVFFLELGVFSIVVGKFISYMDSYAKGIEDGDQSTELERFFNVLTRFNQYDDLNKQFVQTFENYFQYYWQKDSSSIDGEYFTQIEFFSDEIQH